MLLLPTLLFSQRKIVEIYRQEKGTTETINTLTKWKKNVVNFDSAYANKYLGRGVIGEWRTDKNNEEYDSHYNRKLLNLAERLLVELWL